MIPYRYRPYKWMIYEISPQANPTKNYAPVGFTWDMYSNFFSKETLEVSASSEVAWPSSYEGKRWFRDECPATVWKPEGWANWPPRKFDIDTYQCLLATMLTYYFATFSSKLQDSGVSGNDMVAQKSCNNNNNNNLLEIDILNPKIQVWKMIFSLSKGWVFSFQPFMFHGDHNLSSLPQTPVDFFWQSWFFEVNLQEQCDQVRAQMPLP